MEPPILPLLVESLSVYITPLEVPLPLQRARPNSPTPYDFNRGGMLFSAIVWNARPKIPELIELEKKKFVWLVITPKVTVAVFPAKLTVSTHSVPDHEPEPYCTEIEVPL